MKAKAWGLVVLAAAGVGVLTVQTATRTVVNSSEAEQVMQGYEAEQRAAEQARSKDPAWKPLCKEVAAIKIGDSRAPGALRNFCLRKDGDILACVGKEVRRYSPEGKLRESFSIDIAPSAICTGPEDSIFVAGEGRVLKLDSKGKVLATGESPVAKEVTTVTKEFEDMVKEMAKGNRRSYEQELASMKTQLEKRRTDVTGLAATDEDVFMATPSANDFTYRIYRFDQKLALPKLVVEKLRGCCGQMDVQAYAGQLWIPHNARHEIDHLDRDGKDLGKFGKSGKVKPSDFGGCCEPKNMRVLSNGDILAAESGPPTCIKRFDAKGKFKEVVAIAANTKGDCVRVTVEMSHDAKRYYMLDTTSDSIRVFEAKN